MTLPEEQRITKTSPLYDPRLMSQQHAPQSENTRKQWGLFLLLTFSLGTLWLVILPRAAEIPYLHAEIDFLEQKKIDPSAMFYSDLETIEQTVQNINEFHHKKPDALW